LRDAGLDAGPLVGVCLERQAVFQLFDLAFDHRHLRQQALLRGGIALGLRGLDGLGEDFHQGIGYLGCPARAAVFNCDGEQLRVAHRLDHDGPREGLRCDAQALQVASTTGRFFIISA
jgi:hypothetical protein